MTQPNKNARLAYGDIVFDEPTEVGIIGTHRSVKIRGIKPYTIERLTRLWLKRDASVPNDTASTLKSVCIEPYFSIKQAALIVLNGYYKIRLLYPILWRIWAYIYEYSEIQVMPIIEVGKKKLPLKSHWANMAFSVDMRNDWMTMTSKEAEQYRAELLSEASRISAKSSQSMLEED